MNFKTAFRSVIKLCLLLLLPLITTQCSAKKTPELPRDILGISLGMNKDDAVRQLNQISKFENAEGKSGELWRLNNDPRFSHLAVGFDKENKVRYVTALVDKATVKERVRFSSIGDLTAAKKEVLEPHHRYIWQVPASGENSAYFVILNGSDADFLSIYSLSSVAKAEESKE